MGKLRILSGRDVCAILAREGFENVAVPVPDHAEIKSGTLLSIIRQSRLPRTAFES